MFDIGWTEMLVLGIVTLLAVGPRQLPGMLRTIGRYLGQLRQMANEFRHQMDDVADEIDARKHLRELRQLSKKTLGDDFAGPDLFDLDKSEKDKNEKDRDEKDNG